MYQTIGRGKPAEQNIMKSSGVKRFLRQQLGIKASVTTIPCKARWIEASIMGSFDPATRHVRLCPILCRNIPPHLPQDGVSDLAGRRPVPGWEHLHHPDRHAPTRVGPGDRLVHEGPATSGYASGVTLKSTEPLEAHASKGSYEERKRFQVKRSKTRGISDLGAAKTPASVLSLPASPRASHPVPSSRASISDRRCVCEFYQAAKMAPTPFETASLKKEEGRA